MDNPTTSSTPVSLTFPSRQTLAVNDSATYFVVVPKADNASGFKVSLVGKPGSTRDSKYCYEKTKSGSCSFSRNVVQKIRFLSPTKREAVKYYFSVGNNKYVRFSPGNLQWSYTGGGTTATTHRTAITANGTNTGTWRFAEEQWNFVGYNNYGNVYIVNGNSSIKCDNSKIKYNYNGWIDSFGWGTSGYRKNSVPYNTSQQNSQYANGNNNLDGTNDDWGVFNDIYNPVNGITESYGTWRTFSKAEFDYLMTRQNLSGAAKVNGVEGIIILPDNWDYPTGVPSFTPMTKYTGSESGNNQYVIGAYTNNNYTRDEWKIMENHGAVFLPKTTFRSAYQNGNLNLSLKQCYHTSTKYSEDWSYSTEINFQGQNSMYENRCKAKAVRLVKDYTPGQ